MKIVDCLVPGILTFTLVYGLIKGVDVFSVFLEGAVEGLRLALKIFPVLVAMLTAVYMLRASGAIDFIAHVLKPVYGLFGIPPECASLTLLKPISGGGGLALGTEIMRAVGPDSYAGRVAAVMLGSSETSFYTISVYFGALGLKDTRYAVPAALCADAAAFIASAFAVRLFFGAT